jgi:hypothetical protein
MELVMSGQTRPGPIGTETNKPQIDAHTSNRHESHPPGPIGTKVFATLPSVPGFPATPSSPVVRLTPTREACSSVPLTLDELWQLVQSKRGFESSPSPYKSDSGDALRRRPATIDWDAAGRGAKLGDPVETFAALQIVDKDGRLMAIGSDYFDKGRLRDTEADKFDKHAEARVLRALEKAVPGDVPDGSLIGLVDQEVCPACRAKLAEFTRGKKLRMAVVHVPERPKLQSRLGMASPKTTSRTSLQDLRDRAGNPIERTYRESFKLALDESRVAMPRPTFKSRLGAAGGMVVEVLVGLLIDLLAAKVRENIDQKKFEERMRELQPRIEQRKLEAYNAAFATGNTKQQGVVYYNIEIRVITTTTIYVAGTHSNTIPGSPRPEIQSVKISNQQLNSAGPVQEKTRQPSPIDPVLLLEQTQVLIYSEPVTHPG